MGFGGFTVLGLSFLFELGLLNAVHFKYWINAEVNKKSSALV